ncbi:hypothetical protein AQI95_29595 [Streptomyces yokosukanensis]|uniref:Uncharacterized protein n=1 Tax=Streptomyces yokosukanensis TaxID=67386 RepID=A0A101NYW3_9ACTN|nr:hypothetical protein [Streptomyces yokosukanensis]KUN01835.1 hypothetical protein AQI95_29595 [Streptomyces yokosukanensis]
MATKTEEGAEARTDETRADARTAEEQRATGTKDATAPEAAAAEAETAEAALEDEAAGEDAEASEPEAEAPSGVGQGAGAVVSAALGLVSLSGGWIGTVAGAREQLVGQLRTSSTASVASQIKAVYGNAWHTTALWAGLFALAALLTGVVVLARPSFGAPGRPQAPWIKSVAWAGVWLGVIGLLLAVLKYSDALLALPSAG